jgi:hypothetical protein
MKRQSVLISAAGLTLCVAAAPAAAQGPVSARADAELKQSRYQIGQMERLLEGAVEHGATVMRDRLEAVLPPAQAQLLIQENAHARGFRLDGYGVFFDVIVPSLDGSLTWTLQTLDQNDLGIRNALTVLKARMDPTDIDLQQALKRIELQMGPATLASLTAPAPGPGSTGTRNITGSAAGVAEQQVPPALLPTDPILENPNEAWRAEVIQALIDAMLDYSSPLRIRMDEWLTIAARRNEERPRLAPADSGAQSVVIRARGADLAAFRGGQISREEVVKRVDRRVF